MKLTPPLPRVDLDYMTGATGIVSQCVTSNSGGRKLVYSAPGFSFMVMLQISEAETIGQLFDREIEACKAFKKEAA